MTLLVMAGACVVGVLLSSLVLWLARHKNGRVYAGAVIIALNVGLIVMFAIAWHLGHPKIFDPLESDTVTIQMITNRVPGINGPAAHVGDDITVVAVKCNSYSKPVTVESFKTWRTTMPPGSAYQEPASQHPVSERPPGCQTKTFSNPMPAPVMQRTMSLFAAGRKSVTWVIVGSETPYRDDRQRGITRHWFTEPVTLVP